HPRAVADRAGAGRIEHHGSALVNGAPVCERDPPRPQRDGRARPSSHPALPFRRRLGEGNLLLARTARGGRAGWLTCPGSISGSISGSIPGRCLVDAWSMLGPTTGAHRWGPSLAQCGLAELGDERACSVRCDARPLQELGVALDQFLSLIAWRGTLGAA